MRIKKMQQGGDVEALLQFLNKQRTIKSLNQNTETPSYPQSSAPASSTAVHIQPPNQARLLGVDHPAFQPLKTISQESVDYEDPATVLEMLSSPMQTLGTLNKMAIAGDFRRPTSAELDAFGERSMDLPMMFTGLGDAAEVEKALGAGDYGTAAVTTALAFTPIPASAAKSIREFLPMAFRGKGDKIMDDILDVVAEEPRLGPEYNQPFDLGDAFDQHRIVDDLSVMDDAERMQFFEDADGLIDELEMMGSDEAKPLAEALATVKKQADDLMRRAGDLTSTARPEITRGGSSFKLEVGAGGYVKYSGYDLRAMRNGKVYEYPSYEAYVKAERVEPPTIGDVSLAPNTRSDLAGDYTMDSSLVGEGFNIPSAGATMGLAIKNLVNEIPNGKVLYTASLSADSYPFMVKFAKSDAGELATDITKGSVRNGVAMMQLNGMGQNYSQMSKMLGVDVDDLKQLAPPNNVDIDNFTSAQSAEWAKKTKEVFENNIDAMTEKLRQYGLPAPELTPQGMVNFPIPAVRKVKKLYYGGRLTDFPDFSPTSGRSMVKKKRKKSFGVKRKANQNERRNRRATQKSEGMTPEARHALNGLGFGIGSLAALMAHRRELRERGLR